MKRSATLITAIALGAVAGCGGSDTKTVTEVRTVTVTTPASAAQTGGTPAPGTANDPEAKRRRAFCDSAAGDALQQAGTEATKAFNDRDVDAMLAAQERVFRAARKAPEGSSCAVVALNSLRFNWNNGAQSFRGHDYRAEAEKVRRFQADHKLVGALP